MEIEGLDRLCISSTTLIPIRTTTLLSSSSWEQICVLISPSFEVHLLCGSIKSSFEAELSRDTLDTVGRVDVLD